MARTRIMKNQLLNLTLCALMVTLLSACGKEDPNTLDDHFFLRHDGADLPINVHGNRSSNTFLVAIHGAGSFGLAFRNGAFTERLEKAYAVVYWDQRGQGNAQGSYPEPESIIRLMAADITALVEVLKAKYGADIRIVLMGHSLGGLLGLEALIQQDLQSNPNVKGWITISGAHDFERAQRARHDLLLAVSNAQLMAGADALTWSAIRDETLDLDPHNPDNYEAILNLSVRAMNQITRDGLVSDKVPDGLLNNLLFQNNPLTYFVSQLLNQPIQEALDDNYSLENQLPQLTLPSLWLYGKYDFSVPPEIGEVGHHLAGSANKAFVLFDSSAHWLFYTEPDRFGDEVVDFIQALP